MKLTDEQVDAIRADYQTETRASIARRYGVSKAYVTQIILGYRRSGPSLRSTEPLDELAVEQACDGYRVQLRPAERREVVRRLTARGWSARRIALLLGVSERTVVRHRQVAA